MKVGVRRQRWKDAGRYEEPGRCRWCGLRVPRPRRFCGDPRCRDEIRIRAEPRFARRQVGRRDHGVCGICGCDTLKLFRCFRWASKFAGTKALGAEWKELGFHGHWWRVGDRWQADHIIAVVEGGGGCGLENLQTLCTPCHAEKTAALCRELAARRRQSLTASEEAGAVMNIGAAFPSKYLKAATLGDQVARVRIDHVTKEDVSGNRSEEPKPVLYFVGKDKGMVLNKTNARVIEQAYGSETDDWQGKPIEIYVGETQYAGDVVPCLRVRIPKSTAVSGGNTAAARPAPRPQAPSPVSESAEFEEADIPF